MASLARTLSGLFYGIAQFLTGERNYLILFEIIIQHYATFMTTDVVQRHESPHIALTGYDAPDSGAMPNNLPAVSPSIMRFCASS
jgi:hypothetical protein